MPGESFLDGRKSLVTVKIGRKSKMFGTMDGDENQREGDAQPKKSLDWKRPVKNKVTMRPGVILQKPGGSVYSRPAKPSPLAKVDNASSSAEVPDTMVFSSPPEPAKYAAIAKKASDSTLDIGIAPFPPPPPGHVPYRDPEDCPEPATGLTASSRHVIVAGGHANNAAESRLSYRSHRDLGVHQADEDSQKQFSIAPMRSLFASTSPTEANLKKWYTLEHQLQILEQNRERYQMPGESAQSQQFNPHLQDSFQGNR